MTMHEQLAEVRQARGQAREIKARALRAIERSRALREETQRILAEQGHDASFEEDQKE